MRHEYWLDYVYQTDKSLILVSLVTILYAQVIGKIA